MKLFHNEYLLDKDVIIDIGPSTANWSSEKYPWVLIRNGIWHIEAGVLWDGATMVPDGPLDNNKQGFPLTWLATLLHDIGYLLMEEEGFPYNRKEIDVIFYDEMKKAGFRFSWLYYFGVRTFGGIYNALFLYAKKKFGFKRLYPSHTPLDAFIDILIALNYPIG